MTAHDHLRGVVAFEAPHRSKPSFEPAVVALDAVVRVLLGVVKRGGHELIDDRTSGGPWRTAVSILIARRRYGLSVRAL